MLCSDQLSGRLARGALLALSMTLAACGRGGGGGMAEFGGGFGGDITSSTGKQTEATEYSRNFAVHGIDVSKYQGPIDWHAVKAGGAAFAWIKATEGGNHADPRFMENWQGAKAAGVPRGAYHFVYWCRPWQEEMAWFEQNVPVDSDALPPVLDVEATPESRTCKRTLTRESVVPEMRAMLQRMHRHYGKKPIIYVTVDFYQAILADNELEEYPIWIRSTKHHPTVKYGSRHWTFWQYQSDGRVSGIGAKIDRNVFRGSVAEWNAWLKAN